MAKSGHIKSVAGGINLGFVLVCTYIFKCPDWELPDRLFKGMQVIDVVAPSNLYKPIISSALHSSESLIKGSSEFLDNDTWNTNLVVTAEPRADGAKL